MAYMIINEIKKRCEGEDGQRFVKALYDVIYAFDKGLEEHDSEDGFYFCIHVPKNVVEVEKDAIEANNEKIIIYEKALDILVNFKTNEYRVVCTRKPEERDYSPLGLPVSCTHADCLKRYALEQARKE